MGVAMKKRKQKEGRERHILIHVFSLNKCIVIVYLFVWFSHLSLGDSNLEAKDHLSRVEIAIVYILLIRM